MARNGPVRPVLRCPLIGIERKWRTGVKLTRLTQTGHLALLQLGTKFLAR